MSAYATTAELMWRAAAENSSAPSCLLKTSVSEDSKGRMSLDSPAARPAGGHGPRQSADRSHAP